MGGRLNAYVHVADADGATHVFGPEDKVPAWAAKLITNPSAWAEEPEAKQDPASEPAPEPAPAPSPDPGTAGSTESNDYSKWNKAQLSEEIEKRNVDREDDDRIEPEGKNKDDLVAALVADDAAQAADHN